jgi:hypothetical protein
MTPEQSVDVAGMSRVDRSLGAVARRRWNGTFDLDAWGLDSDLVSVLARMLPTVGVRTTGAGRVPDGPALLLWRGGPLGWAHVALGVGAATGRPVRFTGIPDVAPLTGVMHRLGGVGSDIADLRGLLRAGNLVALRLDTGQAVLEESLAGAGWTGEQSTAGSTADDAGGVSSGFDGVDVNVDDWLPDDEVQAAGHVGVPVVPVVVHGPRPWSPWAQVIVGEPVPTRTRRAERPLAEVSAAVAASFAAID